MLERIKLFRNKNKNAGAVENAEANIAKQSHEQEAEEQTEQQYNEKKTKGGEKL